MIKINIKAGNGNEVAVEVAEGTTAEMVLANDVVKSVTDLGDKGQALVNGLEAGAETELQDGDDVEVVSKGNEKG